MLNKFDTLKKRRSFLDVRSSGSSVNCNYLIFNFKKNSENHKPTQMRYGITVSRKIGNAVRRNYIKRLIRALILLNKKTLPLGYNIEIIPKKNIKPLLKEFQRDFDFFKKKLEI